MIRLVRNLRWITTTALSLALVGTACSGPTRTIEEVHFSDYVNPFIGASTNTEAAGAMVPDIATSMRRSRDSLLRR